MSYISTPLTQRMSARHPIHQKPIMSTPNNLPQRRSTRLQGYDYTQEGAYFVTVCTRNRLCLFGDVVADDVRLNDAGRMVTQYWSRLPEQFPALDLDGFVVMPNHVHGIVIVGGDTRADIRGERVREASVSVSLVRPYICSLILDISRRDKCPDKCLDKCPAQIRISVLCWVWVLAGIGGRIFAMSEVSKCKMLHR